MAATTEPTDTDPYRLVAVTWDDPDVEVDELAAWIRYRSEQGWSDWYPLPSSDGHAPDPGSAEEAEQRDGTEPLVVPESDGVQVRVDTEDGTEVDDLRVDLIDPGVSPADASAGSTAPSSAEAANQPRIYTRAEWGADERLRGSTVQYGQIQAGFVHHTVNTNDYRPEDVPAIIRGIYAFHVKSRGYRDVGYNFLIDKWGRIWEGRYGGIDKPVTGAHTYGHNDDAFAASTIGTYTDTEPTAATLDAYARLFAWKFDLHGVDPSSRVNLDGTRVNAISGHRDTYATACPGDRLYAKLPQIRTATAGYMTAAPTTSSPPPPAPAAPAAKPSLTVTVPTNRLAKGSATRLSVATTGVRDGATVVLKRRVPGQKWKTNRTVKMDASGTTSFRVAPEEAAAVPVQGHRARQAATGQPGGEGQGRQEGGGGEAGRLDLPSARPGADLSPARKRRVLPPGERGLPDPRSRLGTRPRDEPVGGAPGRNAGGPRTTDHPDVLPGNHTIHDLDESNGEGAPHRRHRKRRHRSLRGRPQGDVDPVRRGDRHQDLAVCTGRLHGPLVASPRHRIRPGHPVPMRTGLADMAVSSQGQRRPARRLPSRRRHHRRRTPHRVGLRAQGLPRILEAHRSGGSVRAVNAVPMESYLRSVVPNEMPSSWPQEALRAQAVAARTYAMREMQDRGGYFDVYDTTASQVYPGARLYDGSWRVVRNYEASSTNAAISATAGVHLRYGGRPAFTQFSSSNGGVTSGGSQPYLTRRLDAWDAAATANSRLNWTDSVSASSIERAFPQIGRLARIRVTSREGLGDWGGRILTIVLEGGRGSATVSGELRVRRALGTSSAYLTFR